MVGVRVYFEATQTQSNAKASAELAGSFHDAGPAGEASGLLGSRAQMGTRTGGEPAAWHDTRRTAEVRGAPVRRLADAE
jgi:hypothetical protein